MAQKKQPQATKPECKYCLYLKQVGRTDIKFSKGGNRALYYCKHPAVYDILDKHGYPIHGFVGFGDTTLKSPLQLKTCKRWCPLKQKGGD